MFPDGSLCQPTRHFSLPPSHIPLLPCVTDVCEHAPLLLCAAVLCWPGLDIIKEAWSPIHSVSTILTSVQSLLTDPNVASPANNEAAALYRSDEREYRKRVRHCAQQATL